MQIFESGSFDFFLGNVSHHVEAPAVMIVCPNVNHSFYSDSQDAKRVCIEFTLKQNGQGSAFEDYSKLLSEIEDCKLIKGKVTSVSKTKIDKAGKADYEYDTLLRNAVTETVIEVFSVIKAEEKQYINEKYSKLKQSKRNELFAEILRYVEDHFAEQITLSDVAKAHFVSARHIERILHAELNESFTHLVNRFRIENICREMLGGNDDYVSLSAQNGFADYSTFWRNFKRFTGMSPTSFLQSRKKNANN